MKRSFIRYIGGVFLNNQGIALYAVDGGEFEVRAEHAPSGRLVRGTRALTLTADELEQYIERWTDGLAHQDVNIVARALDDLRAAA